MTKLRGNVYCARSVSIRSPGAVGWSVHSSQTAALVTNALGLLIAHRHLQPKVILTPITGTTAVQLVVATP
jgi:putative transposase